MIADAFQTFKYLRFHAICKAKGSKRINIVPICPAAAIGNIID